MGVYRADGVDVSRKGSGAYSAYRTVDGVITEYHVRYRIDGPNAGLWEVRDPDGALVAVEARKRDALRLLKEGAYE